MKLAGQLLLACVLLAIVKAALVALLVVLVAGLVWSAATQPRETAALFVLAIVAGLIRDHGLAFLCLFALALVTGALRCNAIDPIGDRSAASRRITEPDASSSAQTAFRRTD